MTESNIHAAAQAYVASGLSLIPIRTDGTKMPDFGLLPEIWNEHDQRSRRSWTVFRQRRPTPEEIRRWFFDPYEIQATGMAILGGSVSRGLEIMDLDNQDIVGPWSELVEERAPGLLDQLVRVRTPRPGLHVYYRCELYGGSQKLACAPITDPATGRVKPKALIEIKGEGGYCLAPPSPAACHPRNRCYVIVGDRDLTCIPRITPAERDILLEAARELNQWEPPSPRCPPRCVRRGRQDRPGDHFNARAEWMDILGPHGWTYAGMGADGVQYWRRPGKTAGISATVGYQRSDLLYVFSTSAAPFEDQTGYSKFHALALLEFDGDFCRAARALMMRGYGAPRRRRSSNSTLRRRKSRSRTTRGRRSSRRSR